MKSIWRERESVNSRVASVCEERERKKGKEKKDRDLTRGTEDHGDSLHDGVLGGVIWLILRRNLKNGWDDTVVVRDEVTDLVGNLRRGKEYKRVKKKRRRRESMREQIRDSLGKTLTCWLIRRIPISDLLMVFLKNSSIVATSVAEKRKKGKKLELIKIEGEQITEE